MTQTTENIGINSELVTPELPLKAKLMVELAPIAQQLHQLPDVLKTYFPTKHRQQLRLQTIYLLLVAKESVPL